MEFILADDNNVNDIYNIIKFCADDMASKGLMHWIPYYPKEKILEDL